MKRRRPTTKKTKVKKPRRSELPVDLVCDDIWLYIMLYCRGKECLNLALTCSKTASVLQRYQRTNLHYRMLGVLNGELSTDQELLLVYKDVTWNRELNRYFDLQVGTAWRNQEQVSSVNPPWSHFAGLLRLLFQSNQEQSTVKFVVAGGFLFPLAYNHIRHPFDSKALLEYLEDDQPGDLDIFLIASNSDRPQCSVLLLSIIRQWIQTYQPRRPLFIARDLTLTIACDDSKRCLQFVSPVTPSIGSLLTMFDLPCCSWAFDGKSLMTLREAEQSIVLKSNDLHPLSVKERRSARADKYHFRGVKSRNFLVHPLQHLFSLREYQRLQQKVESCQSDSSEDSDEAADSSNVGFCFEESTVDCSGSLDLQILIEYGGNIVMTNQCEKLQHSQYSEMIHIVDPSVLTALKTNEPTPGVKQLQTCLYSASQMQSIGKFVVRVNEKGLLLSEEHQIAGPKPFVQHFTQDFELLVDRIEKMVMKAERTNQRSHINQCFYCKRYDIFFQRRCLSLIEAQSMMFLPTRCPSCW